MGTVGLLGIKKSGVSDMEVLAEVLQSSRVFSWPCMNPITITWQSARALRCILPLPSTGSPLCRVPVIDGTVKMSFSSEDARAERMDASRAESELADLLIHLSGLFIGELTVSITCCLVTPRVASALSGHLWSLTNLDLSGCDLSVDAANSTIAAHVASSAMIQVFSAQGCNLSERGLAYYAAVMGKERSALEQLNFDHNPAIGDDGAECVACAISSVSDKTKLRRISLRQCGIGQNGLLALAKSVLHNRKIIVIACNNCNIPRKKLTKIFSPRPALLAPEDSEVNICLLGDGGIGAKSSMVIRFLERRFPTDYDPTIEDSYRQEIDLDGARTVLNILDTAGQEEFHALREQYISKGEAFALGYAINSSNSFDGLEQLHHLILRAKEGRDYPKIIVGGKTDLESVREVQYTDGKQLARKANGPFYEESALTGQNVDAVFHELARQALYHRDHKFFCGCSPGMSLGKPKSSTKNLIRRVSLPHVDLVERETRDNFNPNNDLTDWRHMANSD
ncbi:GTP-binding protein [Pelomyxa schiedti]|nr:GTP-binding protein [Pelomyxa schiedti]